MQQIATERSDQSLSQHFFMHSVLRPARMAAVKEAQAHVRITLAMTQITTKEAVATRKSVSGVALREQSSKNIFPQALTYSLIRIYTQNPVVTRLLNGKLFLLAETSPVAMNDARAEALCQFYSTILAPRIDDNDLITEGQTIEASR